MARRTRNEEADHRIGGERPGVQGSFHVASNGGADSPSILYLDAANDDGTIDTYAIWVDSTGDLRIKQADNDQKSTTVSDQDSDGTVVGSQS